MLTYNNCFLHFFITELVTRSNTVSVAVVGDRKPSPRKPHPQTNVTFLLDAGQTQPTFMRSHGYPKSQ